MEKPTIFFSHSSKDKDLVMSIKSKIDKETSSVLDIFMSSDGQSIPFGTNWIHKIEEGLQLAKIMFVFVTENSVSSGWIYFEAGYAYSKGIQVIPVGIGIDIGSLKAPLNLLQGFNITSNDSINNFISIINKKFDYHFKESFSENDYYEVISYLSPVGFSINNFEDIVSRMECTLYHKLTIGKEEQEYDLDLFYKSIIEYLSNNNISSSKEDRYRDDRYCCIVSEGVKVLYRKESHGSLNARDNQAQITISVSPRNLNISFDLFKSILQLLNNNDEGYIWIRLKKNYCYVTTDEDGSSILSNYPEFELDKDHVGGYVYRDHGLKFYIFDYNKYWNKKEPDFKASVDFNSNDVETLDNVSLVNKLNDIGFIYNV